MKEYLVIALAGQDFAIPAKEIEEIAKIHDITYVPCARTYVLGVFNLRGRVVTAFSLHRRLGLVNEMAGMLHLVMRRPEGYYSLSIDAARDVRAWSAEEIASLPASLAQKWSDFSDGIYHGHDSAIIVLNTDALFDVFSSRKETA